MAYTSETDILCEDTSSRLLSASVKQTYTELELPPSHLSLLSNIPRFSISLSEMSTGSYDIPRAIPCSASTSALCSPASRLELIKRDAMSMKSQHLNSASHLRPQKWYGQRVFVLPRSASAVDLQAQPRPRLQQTSRLRSSRPSVHDIRSHAKAAACEEEPADPVRCNDFATWQHDLTAVPETSHDEKKLRRRLHYKSYQELHILSMYQDDSSGMSSKITDPNSACTESSEIDEASSIYSDCDTSDSGDSSPFPRTPDEDEFLDQGLDSTLVPRGSRGVKRNNARQVHVIEHRQNKTYTVEVDDSESIPMQATVLTVPGKPRLIQIHRPQHTDHSCMGITSTIDSTLPSTPQDKKHETSKFSPYSTPASSTPFTDISCTASEATPTPKMTPRLSIRTDLTSITYRPSASCMNTPYRSAGHRSGPKQLADPFGSPASIDSNTTIGTLFAQESPPNLIKFSTEDVTSTKPSLRSLYVEDIYEARIRESISSTMEAFDALAANNFTVQSAKFSYFRAQHLNASTDESLVTSLRNIFPQSSSFSRSTLAAWLVVDLHFKQLLSDSSLKPPPYDIDLALSQQRVPTYEHRSNLHHYSSSTGKLWDDRVSPKQFDLSVSLLRPDYIPSKARSVLGIHTDPAGCKAKPFRYTDRQSLRNNLENQARSVHEGVQTLGQKLVRDLLSPPTTPDVASRQKSIRVIPIRSRGSTGGQNNSSSSSECLEASAQALWKACRCIMSLA